MLEEFGGDVYVYDTDDGAEINIVNGLIMPDMGFRTAVYISLFGGNKEDNGEVVTNETWWGNKFENLSENEKYVSRFQAFINSVPMTSKNISLAEEKIKQDLQWFIDDQIAESVDVDIKVIDKKRIDVKIVITKAGEIIESGNYGVQWGNMKDGI